jgi:hypothetical protein
METFIGLQFIQSDTSIRINLDYCIEAILEEYQKLDARVLRGKQTPVQSGVLLSKDDSPAVPDPKRQSIYRSLVAKLQFAATWVRYDIANAVAQLGRFCASAGPTHWTALRHLMCYLSEHTTFQLRYPKNPTTRTGLDGYWQIGPTMRPAVPLPAICFATTDVPSPGSPSQPPKLNIIPHRRRRPKASGCVTSFVLLDSRVTDRLRFSRSTPRASSGAITLSGDVNMPSTLTSANIMHMKLSSLDTFGWYAFQVLTSLLMCTRFNC